MSHAQKLKKMESEYLYFRDKDEMHAKSHKKLEKFKIKLMTCYK